MKKEIRESIKEEIDSKVMDIRKYHIALKSRKKDIEELIKCYELCGENTFRKTYPRCNYNLAELKYYKKELSKAYKLAKAEHDQFIQDFRLRTI